MPIMNRRTLLLLGMAAPFTAPSLISRSLQTLPGVSRIRQSVMNSVWTGSTIPFEERCRILARIGFKAVDLPTREQVPILRQHGLAPAIMSGTGTSFQDGFIRKELHPRFEEAIRAGIDMCVEVGCPNLIGFPGERRGMSREEGADNAVAILSRTKGYAEQKGITLCMEITNSKVAADQRTDQIFDRLGWGLDVCRRVNSPRVKIVYDMYHVQISDGDITRNMRDNLNYICHIHVAGVPTRQEIDDTQEINYRFVANAIAESGYSGYVAHEYRPGPGRDPVKSLEQCFAVMNV